MKKLLLVMLITIFTFACDNGSSSGDEEEGGRDNEEISGATELPGTPLKPIIVESDTKLMVTWEAVDNAASYQVWYHSINDNTSAKQFNDLDNTDTSCTISGLSNDKTYYVWIKAVNSMGVSNFSPAEQGTPIYIYVEFSLETGTTEINSETPGYEFINTITGQSTESTFTIKNKGNDSLNISSIILSDGDIDQFSIDKTNTISTLSNNESTEFKVLFTPTTIGIKNATIKIVNNDPTLGEFTFKITGTGEISGNKMVIKQVTTNISPGSLGFNFNKQVIGNHVPIKFTIENIGNENLKIKSVSLTDGDTKDFSVNTSQMNSIVSKKTSTSFSVTFSPTNPGEKSATITISSNDTNESSFTFHIKGYGLNSEKEIHIMQNMQDIENFTLGNDFDRLLTGLTRDIKFKIFNYGNTILEIGKISINNDYYKQFSLDTGSTDATIEPGDSTEFSVSFKPTFYGSMNSSISIKNNDTDESTYKIQLKGFGYGEDLEFWNKILDLKNYSEATAVITDLNGNVYVGGSYNNTDGKLYKFTGNDGYFKWSKNYLGSVNSIAVDSQNNVYTAQQSNTNSWSISKYNPDGILGINNWNKSFPNSNGTNRVTGITTDSNDNIYVVGYGNKLVSTKSYADWWIKKFDSDGNEDTTNWNKKYHWNNSHDNAHAVAVDSNNNVYVVGCYTNSNNNTNWMIKKFDNNGNEDTTFWNKSFGNPNKNDEAFSIAIDSNDNIYVAGVINASWHIKKFDSNGKEDLTNWNKTFSAGFYWHIAYSIAIDNNNNIYVAGWGTNLINDSSNKDWWIKKFDSNGNEDLANWNKKIGTNNNDIARSITVDKNGFIWIVGFTNETNSPNKSYWWIKKYKYE